METTKQENQSENNLTSLNDIMFNTLRGVVDGTVDEKKAVTIANLSNTIINNAKTQLIGYKLTGGSTQIAALPQQPLKLRTPPKKIAGDGLFLPQDDALQLQYALELGFKNTAEAIVTMPKGKFLDDFKLWRTTNQNQ